MTFVVDGTVAALVAIVVQFLLKPLIEIWLPPDAPRHDTTIRAATLLLGVGLLAVETLIGGPWPATGQAWLLLVGGGALSGLASIGGYHALTGSASPTVTAAVVAETMPTGAANSALKLPTTATFTPSPLHQAAGIAGTWQFPPVIVAAPTPVAPAPVAPEPAPQSPPPVPVVPATPPA